MGHGLQEVLKRYCPDFGVHIVDRMTVVLVLRKGRWKEFVDFPCQVRPGDLLLDRALECLADLLVRCLQCEEKEAICRRRLGEIRSALVRGLGKEGYWEMVRESHRILRGVPQYGGEEHPLLPIHRLLGRLGRG